ncbi:hypothetical protein [Yersinia aleksiciae]|uniref:hypothetical protein n=1 Tax=Yersinia aleksiciae TaxID=263819 RepID=UPI00119E3E21|nr:hypothetical protein [Yersinia aleksiciae]
MMDMTKSQSDFEAWVVTWWPQSKTMIAEKFDDGGYWNMPLQQYFEAWKASRGSIEVELPVQLPDEGYSSAAMHNFCRNDSVKKCAEALRTAGIRIKGESE